MASAGGACRQDTRPRNARRARAPSAAPITTSYYIWIIDLEDAGEEEDVAVERQQHQVERHAVEATSSRGRRLAVRPRMVSSQVPGETLGVEDEICQTRYSAEAVARENGRRQIDYIPG